MSRPPSPAQLAALGTVYECAECEVRYLDERRCPDSNLFCRRIDHGGSCPHCDEPVTTTDVLLTIGAPALPRVQKAA